jgi:hypothetical protein
MRRMLGSLLLALVVIAPSVRAAAPPAKSAAAPPVNPSVQRIKAYHEANEAKLVAGKFTRKSVDLKVAGAREDLQQRWAKMDAYYEGGTLVRIQLYPHEAVSSRTEEFYLQGGRLVYAFIQDKGPKHEGHDMGEPGKEFCFAHDRLIDYVDRAHEAESNQLLEKRMYETMLPYEVEELVDLLAKQK